MSKDKAREQGVALVSALLMTTLATAIVASLFWKQQIQVRSIENQRLRLQQTWILSGAMDWARLILIEDAKFSSTDTLDEPWATPLMETRLDEYVEKAQIVSSKLEATLSGRITDAQARLNLSQLLIDGTPDQEQIAILGRLLESLSLSKNIASRLADFMKATNPTGSSPEMLPFIYLEDLLVLPEIDNKVLTILENYVIFLPNKTQLNVNTAPAIVLAASFDIDLPDAYALIAMRKNASFLDINDFVSRARAKGITVTSRLCSVDSNFFLVEGRIVIGRGSIDALGLLHRIENKADLLWVRRI